MESSRAGSLFLAGLLLSLLFLGGCIGPSSSGPAPSAGPAVPPLVNPDNASVPSAPIINASAPPESQSEFLGLFWGNESSGLWDIVNRQSINSAQWTRHGSVEFMLGQSPTYYDENSSDPIWRQAAPAQRALSLTGDSGRPMQARVLVRSLDHRILFNQTVPGQTTWRFSDPQRATTYEFGISNLHDWGGTPSGSAWFSIVDISMHCDLDPNKASYALLDAGGALHSQDGYVLAYDGLLDRGGDYPKVANLTLFDPTGHVVRRTGSAWVESDVETNGRFIFCFADPANRSDDRLYVKPVQMDYAPADCVVDGTRYDPTPGLSTVDYQDSVAYDGLVFRYTGNFLDSRRNPSVHAAYIEVSDPANRSVGNLSVPMASWVDWTDPAAGQTYRIRMCGFSTEHGFGVPGPWAEFNVSRIG